MSKHPDLFEKTFDQQVDAAGDAVTKMDISPNKRIPAEIVFEPLMGGVRVTARDEKHRVLWGFIGSQGMLDQIHCPVAIYDALQVLLADELKRNGFVAETDNGNPIESAHSALADLTETLNRLKKSIEVKKVTPATHTRAKRLAQAIRDANRQITLETE